MPKKSSGRLPPRKEEDRDTELEVIKKNLKELHEGITQVNGLLVAHTRRQDSVVDTATIRRVVASISGRECHVPPIFSKILHPDRGRKV